ncbi:MAG: ParB N-terminal domain-containing protein [Erythrobacter sp.]|nr:ParB N-terminal domain-containing protein [Erythrobacter sp.]
MTTQSKKWAGVGSRNGIAALKQKLGPIEYKPIGSFKLHEDNPRKHPEKQLVKLAASMREFRVAMPLLIDEQETIIAGEARLARART